MHRAPVIANRLRRSRAAPTLDQDPDPGVLDDAHGLPAVLLFSCGFFTASALAERPVADAEALVDPMLAAVGGREGWASLRNTVNDSLQFRLEEPFVVRAVIRMDFTQPRFRVDTSAPGLTLARVVDGERRWRLSRAGVVEDVPDEVLADDRRWQRGRQHKRAVELRSGRDSPSDLGRAAGWQLAGRDTGAADSLSISTKSGKITLPCVN